MIYSWYLTYPLSTISTDDFVFYHISILYWLSLPLLSASMFLMALTTKSNFLKWILSIGILLTFFSLFYFYNMMPTSDQQQFRAFMEYFIKTKSLDASEGNHYYYQWPAFFILASIVNSISGLTLTNYEFLLYTIIAFLFATALFVYGSKKYTNGGVIVVTAFFISLTYFLDYQPVPFTLGLVLLFLMLMLDAHERSFGTRVIMLMLYATLLITHLFVPLFFVLYLLLRSLFDKNRQNRPLYRNFFLFTLVSYFLVQLTLAKLSFEGVVRSIFKAPLESFSYYASATNLPGAKVLIDNVAQFFSRTVTIAVVAICLAGFIILFIRRNTNAIDKAILFAGVVYSAFGIMLNTLGARAIAVAFLPISLGAAFLFGGKFKPYFAVLFSVLIVLFLFVPLHQSFNTQIWFQTKESYIADNFFLDHYNWENPGFVVLDFWTIRYVLPKLSVYEDINPWMNIGDKPDAILYSPQVVGEHLGNYSSMDSLSQDRKLDLLYNDGISFVITNPNH
jgi:hypothetical protein